MATSSEDHRAARDAFLDTLPAEEQARILRQAEKMGPISTDPDWLVAYAAERSSARAERSAARFEAAVAAAMPMVRTAPSAAPSSPPRGWRWPLTVAALAGGLLLLALASFSGAVAQWSLDASRCRVLGAAMTVPHLPWMSAAGSTIATWPVLPFVIATAVMLVIIVLLGLRKSGPAYRKVFPS